jgi:mono/diheme cytochrome c family protein
MTAPLRLAVATLGAFAFLFTPAMAASDDEPPPLSPSGTFLHPSHFRGQDGATLFRSVCQGCHMPDARGAVGAGMYPALAANPRLASPTYPASVVLHGRHGMPPLEGYMSDAQVAEVVNYVRSHFDNHYSDALTADEVAKLRATP